MTGAIRPADTVFGELRPPLGAERAVVEASRCLECGGRHAQAPCVVACPTHIDIPAFIKQIRDGDPVASARTIFQENVLGGTCARVCPVEELCEGACVLEAEGRRPVEIGRLQRYAADWALERGTNELIGAAPAATASDQSVGVIGSGPAGLACAAELTRRGYGVTVYENRSGCGGLVVSGIAPYKQIQDPLPDEARQIEELGVTFRLGTTIGVDLSLDELERKHDALFLGIGLDGDVSPDLPGKELAGVWRSLELIELVKQGRFEEIDIGDRVAVIGGGNTAIDAAREAIRLGARDVRVLYRRTREQMPAYAHEVEEAEDEGVRFWWLTAPIRVLGEHEVQELECRYMRLGDPDASGRPRPEPVQGAEFRVAVDTVVLAIGQRKRADFLATIDDLQLDARSGLVKTNERLQTTNPKYFAGGDCINGGGTVVEAVQHGKLAARSIETYLKAQAASTAEGMEAVDEPDATEGRRRS